LLAAGRAGCAPHAAVAAADVARPGARGAAPSPIGSALRLRPT
jgi:hypothetical protein